MSNYYKKYHRTFYVLLLTLLIVNCSLLIATVRYVSKTGLSVPPYISWENAADSIQKCINVCVFGDTIYVANGVYQEQVVMIPGLSLIGAGMDSCVIDTRQLLTLQNYKSVDMKNNSLIKGFYIRSTNNFDYGSGIWAEGQNGLIIQNKFSEANRGIDLYGTDIKVYNNFFFNVRSGIGVANSNSIVRKNIIIMGVGTADGIRVEAFSNDYRPIIDSNYIYNVYDTGIEKNLGSRPTIANNEIRHTFGNGIVIRQSDTAKVFNNLIYNAGIGVDNNSGTNLLFYNNYIVGNATGIYGAKVGLNSVIKNNVIKNMHEGVSKYLTQDPIVKYNDLWENDINFSGITPDSTNLSVDPMIVNDDSTQGELDFHLQKYSPLIDAGDPNIMDRDGTRSDIGLYGGPYGESYIYVDLPPRTPVNLAVNVDSLIKLRWNRNTEADFSYYNVYRDTVFNFTIDSTKLIASVTDTFYYDTFPSNVETLYYKLTAVDSQGNESIPSEQVYVQLVPVKNEWGPVNDYILFQNYPNPFNPSTRIGYKLKESGYVKLYVYDIKGELVSVLVNGVQEAGYHEVGFSVGQESIPALSSGVYIYQIMINNDRSILVFSDIKKMIYVK